MTDGNGADKTYSIAAGEPFADRLAQGVLRLAAEDGGALALADILVLLPNRRACRTFQEALLRQAGEVPQLLPAIRPIGDVDEDDLIGRGADYAALDTVLALRPAIPPLLRRLLLARLVLASGQSRDMPPAQALALAGDLARLLDEIALEELSLDDIAGLVPREFAEHWQMTVDFLGILADYWPQILTESGFQDSAARRIALLHAQATAWQAAPPDKRVIIAGSTGSIPATGALMQAVLKLPRGMLVLPGLDADLDDDSWTAVGETHPQYGLRHLLARLGIHRRDVRPWPESENPAQGRIALLRETMRPAETSEHWQRLAADAFPPSALDGLSVIDCDSAEEEALVIALILRESLEQPERRAALVTLDRNLARRVATHLKRWRIEIDDSAGVPLGQTVIGRFFGLLAEAVNAALAPAPLLALLKHPLSAAGRTPADFAASVRLLDRKVLRGPRPPPGIDGLRRAAEQQKEPTAGKLLSLIDALHEALTPIIDAVETDRPMAESLDALLIAAEALAATGTESGADRLWRGEDGEAARRFFADLRDALAATTEQASSLPADRSGFSGRSLAILLGSLMQGQTVRPRFGSHPRLSILGPLEARLYRADIMILGGLNEESWPPRVDAGPWLSRPMRGEFKLPAPERMIGLSAHDFVQAAAAPRAILTRSLRSGNAPTVPARWLRRLETVLDGAGLADALDRGTKWRALAATLDHCNRVAPASRPAPCPPLAARPRTVPVTDIETWRRDPYALYAKRILTLHKLDDIDQQPEAAERGTWIHHALELFMQRHLRVWPEDPLGELLKAGKDAFGDRLQQSDIWAFWWPRFVRIAAVFAEIETRRRADFETVMLEAKGSLSFAAPAGDFTLTAKADRIDRRRSDGALAIIDYKTGSKTPSKDDIHEGFAPQLTLQAAIAMQGFGKIEASPVAEIAYWLLNGSTDAKSAEKNRFGDIDMLSQQALEGLQRWVGRFDRPATAYRALPFPGFEPAFSDYDLLSRRGEWQNKRPAAE